MKCLQTIFFITLACLAVSLHLPTQEKCDSSPYPPSKQDELPRYVVDLDLSPLQRWMAVMKDKGPQVIDMVNDVMVFMKTVLGEKVFQFIADHLENVAPTLPFPFYEEMVGIAAATSLPVGYIALYNIFYEAFTLCTSIVAQDPDGHLYHGRNLDTGVFLGWDSKNHTWRIAERLRPLSVIIDWKKNGSTVFTSVSFAGYVGVLTAVKKEKFSFSLDKRFSINGGFMGLLEWILFHDHDQRWVAFLTREVLQEAQSYEEARQRLSSPRLLAPVYFILGGVKANQGCIITRSRDTADIISLGSSTAGSGSWFLVQTNYDHWKSPPFFDDRRTPATHCMQQGGPMNASLSLIYHVLSTKPVLNKGTVYTALMEAESGQVRGWTRSCPDPCWPW